MFYQNWFIVVKVQFSIFGDINGKAGKIFYTRRCNWTLWNFFHNWYRDDGRNFGFNGSNRKIPNKIAFLIQYWKKDAECLSSGFYIHQFFVTFALKIAISSRFIFFSTLQTFHVYNLNKWHDTCQKEKSIMLEIENCTLFLRHLLTQAILSQKKVNIDINSRILLFRVSNRNLSLFITRFKCIYQCQKMIVTLQHH